MWLLLIGILSFTTAIIVIIHSNNKPILIWTYFINGFFGLFFISLGILYLVNEDKLKTNAEFYDGEGNQIPNHIVDLEVKSHFVKLKQSEKDSINKYFYLDTLK